MMKYVTAMVFSVSLLIASVVSVLIPKSESIPTAMNNYRDIYVTEKQFDRLAYASENLDSLINKYARKYKLDENLVKAVIQLESNFESNLINVNNNGTKDRGLMQINEATAIILAEKLGFQYDKDVAFDISKNLQMGMYYLSYLKKKSSDIHYVLTAYNRGPTGAKNYYERTGTYETSYSRVALKHYHKFNRETIQVAYKTAKPIPVNSIK
ncbi:lytic transglycosylase domain-containing protein [Bacillus sp. HMF5848]|uniref:lytic transglycosylase domain-containing protein n=1 Tax=Bacillus sp. HMF5848 TaxID=2495421 RepID=UPI000F7767CE|nr:transglycosylase SLT domain-containing protein [Bacillus sp. HMF5848]RSK26779.1 lytic transglycosylase domain-containing protein [Bacillus sp. HMF5848]